MDLSPGFGAIRQIVQTEKKVKLSWQLHPTNTAFAKLVAENKPLKGIKNLNEL